MTNSRYHVHPLLPERRARPQHTSAPTPTPAPSPTPAPQARSRRTRTAVRSLPLSIPLPAEIVASRGERGVGWRCWNVLVRWMRWVNVYKRRPQGWAWMRWVRAWQQRRREERGALRAAVWRPK